MDLSLNEMQEMLADSIEKFVANDYDFDTRQKYVDSEAGFSNEVWQTFADLGWTSILLSEADGGFGGGPVDLMVVMLSNRSWRMLYWLVVSCSVPGTSNKSRIG